MMCPTGTIGEVVRLKYRHIYLLKASFYIRKIVEANFV
jgi:hypothetical protein